MHLAELPDVRAKQNPDGPCIGDDSLTAANGALSNAEFLDSVQRAAAALAEVGVGRGDVVAVMLDNRIELVTVLFAAWRVGAAVTPINPALTAAEAGHQISDSGARVVIAEHPIASSGVAVLRLDQLARSALVSEPVTADGLALLIYTSGTTGRPKGVMLDHSNLIAMCTMAIDAFELDATAHSLLILPLFHVNGIVVSVLSPLLAGGRSTIAGRFHPDTFFDRIEQSGATYFSAVPTIYAMLAALPESIRPDTSSLRFAVCGAAPASVELLAKFESRFGVPIIEGYGLSEGTCATTVNPLNGIRKAGTVGLPLPGQSVRVVDNDGATIDDGRPGEVVVAGPNVMRGYLNRPDETATTLIDGWLHTGDIGRFDEDGYLILVDRAKDMIIRGGENIYPKEIETVAYELPDIFEAAVIARAHPTLGEVPILFVALNAGAAIDEADINDYLATNLTRVKLPVEIYLVEALPKNPVGKIDKRSLREYHLST